MQTYRDFSPTPFDRTGINLPDRQDWLVAPVSISRDSDSLAASNWDATLSELGAPSQDAEIHRFNHWGVGWLEIMLVRPGSDAARKAQDIEDRLRRYPCLDEEDMSRREFDAYKENWKSWGADEFVRLLCKRLGLSDEQREDMMFLDDADKERLRHMFEELNPNGTYIEGSSPNFDPSVAAATVDDIVEFLAAPSRPTPSSSEIEP